MRASRIGGGRLGRRVRIEVEDAGLGIAEASPERIFESFEQADESIAERFGGTGRGLPIARRFVELHGGSLTVVSTPGAGSTFAFDLAEATSDAAEVEDAHDESNLGDVLELFPANDSEYDDLDAIVPPSLAIVARVIPERAVRGRVLVADDAPANLEVPRALLEPAGFVLTCASDGEARCARPRRLAPSTRSCSTS